MKRVWDADELVEQWTLTPGEIALLDPRTGHNRLGFAVLLKCFDMEGRFPRHKHEIPAAVVAHVAAQVGVPAAAYLHYDWRGRSIEQHRADIRALLGFRTATVQDGHDLVAWLCTQEAVYDRQVEPVKAAAYARCRALRVEPPSPDRVDRLVRSAMHTAEERVCAAVHARLPQVSLDELDALLDTTHLAEASTPAGAGDVPLHALKADPGRVGLDSVLAEVAKLQRLRRVGLPADLFRDVPPKLVATYRHRPAAPPPRARRLNSSDAQRRSTGRHQDE